MAMYLVEYKSNSGYRTEYVTIAVGSPGELLQLLMLLDNSDRVEHWVIINHKPSDFGWGDDGWHKQKAYVEI